MICLPSRKSSRKNSISGHLSNLICGQGVKTRISFVMVRCCKCCKHYQARHKYRKCKALDK